MAEAQWWVLNECAFGVKGVHVQDKGFYQYGHVHSLRPMSLAALAKQYKKKHIATTSYARNAIARGSFKKHSITLPRWDNMISKGWWDDVFSETNAPLFTTSINYATDIEKIISTSLHFSGRSLQTKVMRSLTHLKNPTKAPAKMVTPIKMLEYASIHVESTLHRRISNDITKVAVERAKSALTCKKAENMFTLLPLPVFLGQERSLTHDTFLLFTWSTDEYCVLEWLGIPMDHTEPYMIIYGSSCASNRKLVTQCHAVATGRRRIQISWRKPWVLCKRLS